MNSKQLKFLQTFSSLSNVNVLDDKKAFYQCIKTFLDIDYQMAVDVWEYISITYENDMIATKDNSAILASGVFDLFYEKSSVKCAKAINELMPIRKAVYQYSPDCNNGGSFNILVDLLLSNKTTEAEEIFKFLVKNERIHYGKMFKAALERLFIEILKKNPAKKIEMSRKLTDLLLRYIAKIKTEEKALLEQRVRETL